MLEQTFVLLKPDALQRSLGGEIIARFDRRGYRLVALKLTRPQKAQAESHYAEHEGKFFYSGLVDHLTSGPAIAMILEGPSAVASVRKIVGATRPPEADAGTIRGDFGQSPLRNLVHAADSVENAAREAAIYFSPVELLEFKRDADNWIFEPADLA